MKNHYKKILYKISHLYQIPGSVTSNLYIKRIVKQKEMQTLRPAARDCLQKKPAVTAISVLGQLLLNLKSVVIK